jgi:hypothetical protein
MRLIEIHSIILPILCRFVYQQLQLFNINVSVQDKNKIYLSMFTAFSFPLSQSWERGWGEGVKVWYLPPQPICPPSPPILGGTGLNKLRKQYTHFFSCT